MNNDFIHQSTISYRKYLAELHSTFGIPQALLATIVEEATGNKIKDFKRIINGESNEIYDVRLPDDSNIIIKISRPKYYLGRLIINDFKKEQWISEQCLKLKLPVAKVLFLRKYSYQEEIYSVCVQEKLRGVALNDLVADGVYDKEELTKVAIELGGLASSIHSIETVGFGDIDGKGFGEFDLWSEFMYDPFRKLDRLTEAAVNVGLKSSAMEEAYAIIQHHEYIYNKVKPRLLYGDFNPRNVLVKDLKITGLIDFEHSLSGDPVYDISRWDYFYAFHEFDTSLLLNQYKDKELFGGNFVTRFHLNKLRLGVDMIEYFEGKKNELGIKVALTNFANSMKYFSSYYGSKHGIFLNSDLQ